MGMLRGFIQGLAQLIYPKVCLTCRKNLKRAPSIDNLVCLECWQKIKKNLPPFCCSCGRHLEKTDFTKRICLDCTRKNLIFDRAFSPCVYEGVIKELIHAFKYKNKDYLGKTLSRPMIDFIQEFDLPINYIDFIIPVPLHKIRLREREFNQAEILSGYIAREFKKEVLSDKLIRRRQTKQQTDLEVNQRFLNVKDTFSINRPKTIKGKNILLVDDVLTSGATASEAAFTLKNAEANIVFVLTLAN